MIDSMYANEEQIEAWFRASPRHRLITVGEDTLQWNEQLTRDMGEVLTLDRVPPTYETWPAETKTADRQPRCSLLGWTWCRSRLGG